MNYCYRCSKPITSKYGKKFCSNQCAAENGAECAKAALRKDHSSVCPVCGRTYERYDLKKSKFCSHSCAAKFNNRQSHERRGGKQCVVCNKWTEKGRDYCSRKCKASDQMKQWLAGTLNPRTVHGCPRFVKDYIFGNANYMCEKCGFDRTREDGSVVLELHHIDGNWKNNAKENLQCLCPNCHALTPNYRARNKRELYT